MEAIIKELEVIAKTTHGLDSDALDWYIERLKAELAALKGA